MMDFAGNPGIAVAWAHLIFNLTIGLVFLATLDWMESLLRRCLLVDAPAFKTRPAYRMETGCPGWSLNFAIMATRKRIDTECRAVAQVDRALKRFNL